MRFELNGSPFPVCGVNCYFLAYCGDSARRCALAAAKRMGSTVVRAWAFLLVEKRCAETIAFQYCSDGRIHLHDGPNGLNRLDALIQAAEEMELKLILPLVNYWPDFGGMPAYVRCLGSTNQVAEFYWNADVRAAYREWVTQILTRRNTLTGRLYSEEPSIMAWELTNEARFAPFEWIEEMSGYVKERDSNHLLALGDEGFFGRKGGGHLYDGRYGMDWEKNLSLPNMDFGTFHFYPQDWGYGKRLHFGKRWIRDHAEVGRKLNKPVLLEEFGLRSGERGMWYERWMKAAPSGSLVWMLGHDSPETAGFKDDFVLYEASHPGEWLARDLDGRKS